MDGISLVVRSFADVDIDRALEIAHAFDASPSLRPLKVGGDPARVAVKPSMAAVFSKNGLPINWLTVRGNGRAREDFEGGDITLFAGRGSWTGDQSGGVWNYKLSGHTIRQSWTEATARDRGALDAIERLFEDLVVAADAAHAYVRAKSQRPDGRYGEILHGLPGVFWMNYFSPAFLERWPELSSASGARLLATGGVLVKTRQDPWKPEGEEELRLLFAESTKRGGIPTTAEFVAASPGTQEMPWVAWERSKVLDGRARRHANAQRRLLAALALREPPRVAAGAAEWSTSFDTKDWVAFARYLTRKVRGELAGELGKALVLTVANAPLEDESDVTFVTEVGVVNLGWFVDDTDTVDIYIHGPAALVEVCAAWFND